MVMEALVFNPDFTIDDLAINVYAAINKVRDEPRTLSAL